MGGMGLLLTDYTMFQVYEDAEKQLEIAMRTEEAFPTDFIYPIDFGTVFQHALGFAMKKPELDFPSVLENKIKTIEDIEKSPMLDMESSGLFHEYLSAISKISITIEKPQMVACVGPLTLATELAGLEFTLKSTVKNTVFFRKLLEYASGLIIDFSRAAILNGATVLQISEPVMSIVRPGIYQKEVLPWLKQIINTINECAISSLHVCGNTEKYLDLMVESGTQILSLDQVMDLKYVMEHVPKEVVVAGNLDPVETMLNGTYELVYQKTEELLTDMSAYSNFMVSFGCDCPINTPIEHIKAVSSAIKKEKKER